MLSLASSVLEMAIKDCVQSSVFLVGKDSRKAWIILLNHIYPSDPTFHSLAEAVPDLNDLAMHLKQSNRRAILFLGCNNIARRQVLH